MIRFINQNFITRSRIGLKQNVGGFDDDALTYFSNANITDSTQKNAINTFITTIKPTIWNKGIDVGIYLGGTVANGMKKLKYPGSFSTNTSTGTQALTDSNYSLAKGVFSSTGGTKRMSTQIVPADHGLSKDNFCFIVGITDEFTSGGIGYSMLDTKATGRSSILLGKNIMGMNGGALTATIPFHRPGTMVWEAMSSNSNVFYTRDFGQVLVPQAPPSVTFDTAISLMGGRDNAADVYYAYGIGFHFIGSYLTYDEIMTVQKAARTMMQTIGRASATKDVVTFGDSITFGSGASVYTNRWSYQYATARGLVERCYGQSGSQFTQRASGLLSGYERWPCLYNYDILNGGEVVFFHGVNDARNGVSSATFKTMLLQRVQEALDAGLTGSQIKILSVPQIWDGTSSTTLNNYRDAAMDVCVIKGVHGKDIKTYMIDNGDTALDSGDHLHPNDTGHGVIKDGALLAGPVS